MSPPPISVLLPARNAAHTVDAAVESVLAQTRRDFELLAIDDGSTDDTRARLDGWASRDGRVRVLDGGGRGLVSALNLGLHEATGRLLARMDADDLSLPLRFERSADTLEAEPVLCGVGTGVDIFRDDRPVTPNLQRYGAWLNSLITAEQLFRERFVESPLCHPSVMLRREAVLDVGGWRDGDFPEDWDLWLRLLESGRALRCLNQVLFRWRDHDQRATRTDARYHRKRHLGLKAQFLAARFSSAPITVWGTGQTGLGLSKRMRALGVTVRRFIEVHPRKIGTRIHDVPVESVDQVGPPRGEHLLTAVGTDGARDEIRGILNGKGWQEGAHFTCVA